MVYNTRVSNKSNDNKSGKKVTYGEGKIEKLIDDIVMLKIKFLIEKKTTRLERELELQNRLIISQSKNTKLENEAKAVEFEILNSIL